MRRLSASMIFLGLCALALPGIVSAAPQVTFKAAMVPIVGFPHTGNLLRAGAAIHIEYTVSGSEALGGRPQPLSGLNLYLPTGFRVHPAGIATCPLETLRLDGPDVCPPGSAAGPVGQVLAGRGSVPQEGTFESFYLPGGGLEFYEKSYVPRSLEIYWHAHFVNLAGAAGFGPEMIDEVGQGDTEYQTPSTEKVNMRLGSAYRAGGSAHYAVALPKKCPRGGFPIKAELKFAPFQGTVPTSEGQPNLLLPEQSVTKPYKMVCPRK